MITEYKLACYSHYDTTNTKKTSTWVYQTLRRERSFTLNSFSLQGRPGTTYWVRAVADNDVCSSKGEIKEFKTLSSQASTVDQLTFAETTSSKLNSKSIRYQLYEWLKKNFDNEAFGKLAENNPKIQQLITLFING